MIGYIQGKIIHKEERLVVVLSGGVGYAVAVTPAVAEKTPFGAEIHLWTHLSVKETALELYGFGTQEDLGLFRLLIGISGIGPKSALNILSLADHKTLTHAIARGDGTYLTKVSGIGKKLAEKIVLELKDKVARVEGGEHAPRAEDEALDALEALGYGARDTRDIVRALAKEHETVEDIIRLALQKLGGR